MSRGKLFCNACREEVSLKRSSVRNHTRYTKHNEGKKELAKRVAREQEIAVSLKPHNAENHLVGETLPDEQQIFRVKVVTFFRAGVPLSKLIHFKGLLEEVAYNHTNRHNLSDLVPFIQPQEKKQLLTMLRLQH